MSRNPDFDAVMIKKTELEQLEADNARLRAALDTIANDMRVPDLRGTARRALEPKR